MEAVMNPGGYIKFIDMGTDHLSDSILHVLPVKLLAGMICLNIL